MASKGYDFVYGKKVAANIQTPIPQTLQTGNSPQHRKSGPQHRKSGKLKTQQKLNEKQKSGCPDPRRNNLIPVHSVRSGYTISYSLCTSFAIWTKTFISEGSRNRRSICSREWWTACALWIWRDSLSNKVTSWRAAVLSLLPAADRLTAATKNN